MSNPRIILLTKPREVMSADEFLQDSKWISGPSFLWESDISNYQEVPTTKVQPQDPGLERYMSWRLYLWVLN